MGPKGQAALITGAGSGIGAALAYSISRAPEILPQTDFQRVEDNEAPLTPINRKQSAGH